MSHKQAKLPLIGRLTIRDAEALASEISAAVHANEKLTIDTAGIESADTAVLQILISAHKTAAALGHRLSIRAAPGTPIHTTMTAAGLMTAAPQRLKLRNGNWTGIDIASDGAAL